MTNTEHIQPNSAVERTPVGAGPTSDGIRTIFIAISGRQQARNILRTDVLKTLLAVKNVRVVVLVHTFKLEHFRKEFQLPNLLIEGVDFGNENISRLDAFFNTLSLYYVNTTTGRFLKKLWFWHEHRRPLRYLAARATLAFLGNLRPLRTLARFLDFKLVKDNRLAAHFKTYHPDLVFAPNVTLSIDRSLIRHAKRFGVQSAGMVNSWDNITYAKYPFRILPDLLMVHNDIIKAEAMRYLDVPESHIFVSGIPQQDFYTTHKRSTREAFCKRLGIDPVKKILLFTSQGTVSNETEWQTLQLFARAFDEGKLPKGLLIIYRQHPTEKNDLEKIPKHPNIVVDDSKTVLVKGQEGFSEILEDDMEHLANSLYHEAVVITTTSTISIDAARFDKPIINMAFDGWEERPFWRSVRRKFTKHHAHYQHIVHSGGVYIVNTFEEMPAAINRYLEHPEYEREGRTSIVREQCQFTDGKSGQRIGNALLERVQ